MGSRRRRDVPGGAHGGGRRTPPAPIAEDPTFEEAMVGVTPIEADRHLAEPVFRKPVPLTERERETLLELDRIVSGEAELSLADTDEYVQGAVSGLDRRVLKRLRRGEFSVQADLDLHGVDAATARELVLRLIEQSSALGLRCVRIVHGRGRNSPGGIAVLKTNLPRWLARGSARRAVLAYTSATPQDGGAGAMYVLLRKASRR